jgi:hypothetical protein
MVERRLTIEEREDGIYISYIPMANDDYCCVSFESASTGRGSRRKVREDLRGCEAEMSQQELASLATVHGVGLSSLFGGKPGLLSFSAPLH